MLIENKSYKRNLKNGKIFSNEPVVVKCELCESLRTIPYAGFLRKQRAGKDTKCRRCACRERALRKSTRQILSCNYCKKAVVRTPCQIKGEGVFCGIKCRDDFLFQNKYSHLQSRFLKNQDEASYLCGLILGDGHQKRASAKTSRITIAFDERDRPSQAIAVRVLRRLGLCFFKEKTPHKTCRCWGFAIPNEILRPYKMLWCGEKFKAKPSPSASVVENINFAAGLINSDGCCSRSGNGERLVVSNTVPSIMESFKTCLSKNNILFTSYLQKKKPDKRTGRIYKSSYNVSVGRQDQVAKLRKICKYGIKKLNQSATSCTPHPIHLRI